MKRQVRPWRRAGRTGMRRRGAGVRCYRRGATRETGGQPRTRPWAGSARRAVAPRTGVGPYAPLLAVPRPLAFSLAGWVAPPPLPMLGLGADREGGGEG